MNAPDQINQAKHQHSQTTVHCCFNRKEWNVLVIMTSKLKNKVSDSTRRQQRSALAQHRGVHCFVNLWFIISSCLGSGDIRPSHNILLFKSYHFWR